MSRLRFVVAGTLLCALPALASASNGTHQRTPVQWEGTGGECMLPELAPQCMTLVDRTDDAVMHIPYRIPYPDTMVTPDEVADSRRHQFFALCRQHDQQEYLPNWISDADVTAAEAKMLVEPGTTLPSEVMETSTVWDGCWHRIVADADRRPIVCEMASAGVDWDTSDVPAGVYAIEGYTYEPAFNVWVQRPGVVKVHDGDPEAIGPAAAFSTGELTPYRDDVVTVEGCVDALPGTTFTVSWALADETIEWIEYSADLPIGEDGTFTFEFAPPEDLVGESGIIKADFVDPMDRAYTAHMNDNIIVINADNPNGCHDGGGFIGSPCAEDSGGSSGDSGGDDDGETTAGIDAGDDDDDDDDTDGGTVPGDGGEGPDPKGCSCTSGGSTGASLFAMVGVVLLRRRRRPA
jgi:uncharacterized protein (TIGR03382 family)